MTQSSYAYAACRNTAICLQALPCLTNGCRPRAWPLAGSNMPWTWSAIGSQACHCMAHLHSPASGLGKLLHSCLSEPKAGCFKQCALEQCMAHFRSPASGIGRLLHSALSQPESASCDVHMSNLCQLPLVRLSPRARSKRHLYKE